MNTQNLRVRTLSAVKAIMNKRPTISETYVGQDVEIRVQRDGSAIYVKNKDGEPVESIQEPGTQLRKMIFNGIANSGIALNNPANKQLFKDAVAAEKAGDGDKAAELYNEFLNATQFSFSMLLPNRTAEAIKKNTLVTGTVQRITTDAGSLLTLDPSTVSIKEATKLTAAEFDVDGMLGEDEEVAEEAAVGAEEA